jgi:salicylate hydroxylase
LTPTEYGPGPGLGAALAQSSVRPLAGHERRWDDGRTLLRVPLADAAVAAFGLRTSALMSHSGSR